MGDLEKAWQDFRDGEKLPVEIQYMRACQLITALESALAEANQKLDFLRTTKQAFVDENAGLRKERNEARRSECNAIKRMDEIGSEAATLKRERDEAREEIGRLRAKLNPVCPCGIPNELVVETHRGICNPPAHPEESEDREESKE